MPWGETSMPAPKLFRSLPDESNLRIGSTVGESRHALLPPHRSATQMLLPSLSISTALSDPHFRPSGSCAQFSTVRYGFGASLVGEGLDCAAERRNAATRSRINPAKAGSHVRLGLDVRLDRARI